MRRVLAVLVTAVAVGLPSAALAFGDGVHVVGRDIRAGTYRAEGGAGCSWARLSGLGGPSDEVIASGSGAGPIEVRVLTTDAALESQGCGEWTVMAPSAETVTYNLCLTLTGPVVASVEELTSLLQDGTVAVDAFADGGCGGEPTSEPTAVPASDQALPVEVVESGFSYSGGSLHYAVIFRNPNPSGWVAQYMPVQIAMVDDKGDLLDSASENITLLPGQTSAVVGSVEGARETADLEVQLANGEDDWEEIDFTAGDLSFAQVKLKRERYSNEVTGRITSEFSEQQESLQLIVVYRRGGRIVGGDYTYVEFVPAGGRATFKIFSDFETLPAGVKVETYYSL